MKNIWKQLNELVDTSDKKDATEVSADDVILITIQGKKVLNILEQGSIYMASYEYSGFSVVSEKSYRKLAKLLKLKSCPIFCAPKDNQQSIAGSDIEGADKKELKLMVPKNRIKVTEYYSWTDYLYYTELAENSEDRQYLKDLEKEFVVDANNSIESFSTPQIILDEIRPEWLIAGYDLGEDDNY